MSKILKKVTAFILSLSLAASVAGVAFAANADDMSAPVMNVNMLKKAKDFEYPVIFVPGINHSPTYLCDENGERMKSSDGADIGGTLMIFDNDVLKKELLKLIVPLLGSLITQKDYGLTEKAYEVVKNIFYVQETNEEGKPVNNLITRKFDYPVSQMNEEDKKWFYIMLPVQKLSNEIGEENIWLYTFNLVGDPMESAKGLDDYIQMVKQKTGKDKVILVDVSLGGTIFTAYVDEYGYKDVHQVVNIVAATDGTDIIADMLMRKFNLTDEYFYNDFVSMIAEENLDDISYGYLINIALRLLPKSVFQTLITRTLDGMLENLMINTPQIWATVPSARYDELCEKYFPDDSKPVLKAKLDRYHEAQLHLKENVLKAKEAGVRIDNICGSDIYYGEDEYTFFNIVKSASTVNGDGIIPLYSAGMGATGADKGKTLEAYDEKYTNDARTVDLSTSYLPDNTWVFQKQHHEVGNNSVVLNLAKDIIVNPESLPTNSAVGNKYPQFNGTQHDKTLRRWRLPAAESIDRSFIPAEYADEFDSAVNEARDVLSGTVADAERTDKATENLSNVLIKIGAMEPEKQENALMPFLRMCTKAVSKLLLGVFGDNGFSDGVKEKGELADRLKDIFLPSMA